MAKQIYETQKIREWKMKEPQWAWLWFFITINVFFHLILIPNFETYLSRMIIFLIIFLVCYIFNGTYPYYKVRYITIKRDAIRGKNE